MKTVFLMIARILYDKGYAEYVEAARIIKKKYPDTEFQLLGRIDEEYPNHVPKEVVEKDDRNGIIHYLGHVSNVIPIIEKANCIVHPTFYNEGLSRVLLEAMALQKVIITTDIPGCKETVDEGINGYIVSPRNVDELVQAISKFLSLSNDDRKEMGIRGREKAENEFDVKHVIAVYRKITG